MAKVRQSNLELCRLASILLVMLVHTTYTTLGTDVSFGVMLLEGFSIIGVNVFILLTGYFSATPKKSNLINLAFICLFWMIVRAVCRYMLGEPLDYKYVFFITSSNWFIASYVGLLFFAPILNVFSNTVSKKTLFMCVLLLILLEIWFDWIPPTPKVRWGVQCGYSVLSFAILYLLARAIRLYGLPNWFKKYSPLIYIGCSIAFAIMMYCLVKSGYGTPGAVEWVMAYINPIVIVSSVAFLTMFEQFTFHSRFINYIAKSTLACLFGHIAILPLYKKQFLYIYENYTGIQVAGYWLLSVVLVLCASIAIDQIRLLLYKPIERLVITRIKNNEILPTDY